MEDKRYKFYNACVKAEINWQNIFDLYQDGMSGNEISEYLQKKYNITVSSKHLTDKIKKQGILRNYKDRKINAIKRGRMIYYREKKHILSPKIRMQVLKRDNFKCVLCGNSPKTGHSLEVYYKNGDKNDIDNLQTLCLSCYRGIHYKGD